MDIALSPALLRFVDNQVETGRYLDAGDVVRTSLRRMEAQFSVLTGQSGWLDGGDIMDLAFIVMMEAAQSAREDLKSVMEGVKAINREKDGWRQVMNTVNKYAAAGAGKHDDFKASDMGNAIPHGSAASIANKPIGTGTLDEEKQLVFNTPDRCGATVPSGLIVAGTGQPGGFVTKKDIDTVRETIEGKLDSLSEMSEMEQLRLQMFMDRVSKMMSTLSNLLKRASETTSGITQNIK